MNASRKSILLAATLLIAALAIGMTASSAEAGNHGYHNVHKIHSFGYPSYFGNYSSYYGHSCYWPTYQVVKPISYPVTYYDFYGRPYVVWQTSYSYAP